jgi:opacity protein-like surface antigen
MKRFTAVLFSILLAAAVPSLRGQAIHSAASRQASITIGGTASIFQPDYEGAWTSQPSAGYYYPVAQAGSYPLFGAGAYVDVKFTRWVQIEAEGRWLRFNQFDGIYQDNYLIGPRVPIHRFGKATVYGKALIGDAKMHFDSLGDHGEFTTLAFGGGVDYKLTKRFSIRALDAEYQYWPKWGNSTLSPYGASVGIGYKIF